MPTIPSFVYERGEHRSKHCWTTPAAGFVPSGRGAIGKCSSKLDDVAAQQLLNSGIAFRREPDSVHPDTFYNVYEGVPYEAAPTQAGKSFHGYPWRGRMPEAILEELSRRAAASGHAQTFKKWLKQYSEMHR